MAMKLLSTFLTTAAFYLAIYFIFLLFLIYAIDISPETIKAFFGKNFVYLILIIAGCKSWDKVFSKKVKSKKEQSQRDDIE